MHNHSKNHKSAIKMRHGSALAHGKAHTEDHCNWSRRSFLRNIGIAGSMSMMLGKLPVSASAASPLSYALNNSETDRILVLVRLKGGNDGLNTIVPLYDYSTYINKRPKVGLKQSEITKLTDAIGIPKTFDPLLPFWEEGKMKVIHNVGYPEQNLSHFRSSDIWASASDPDDFDASGWYGRYIADEYPDFLTNPPEIPPAIQIGGAANVAFNDASMTNLAISVRNPEEIAEIAQTGQLYSTMNLPECYYGEQVGFVRAVANNTFIYAGILSDTYKSASNSVEYQGDLGAQLAIVARLIKGNLGTKLYMVSIDGFDTHANQIEDHPPLMREVAAAINSFYKDLTAGGRDKDVLTMTISEFGRRIEENGSNGTDHGAAAPMLLFGEGLNGSGFIGDAPDLQNVDEVGNLVFSTDFRSVYATVMESWLCVNTARVDGILGQQFERISQLGISCNDQTTATHDLLNEGIEHEAQYAPNGAVYIRYKLKEGNRINLQVFNLLGQPITTLVNAYQPAGAYKTVFHGRQKRLAKGQYFYRIQVGNRAFSRAFILR